MKQIKTISGEVLQMNEAKTEVVEKGEGKHTKGILSESPYRAGLIGINFADPVNTYVVCQVLGYDEEAKANAARIVEAWNNFDRLQEENRELKDSLQALFNCCNEYLKISPASKGYLLPDGFDGEVYQKTKNILSKYSK